MTILISSLPYVEGNFDGVLKAYDLVANKENVGIEVFPVFNDPRFSELLSNSMDRLKTMPISLHGPYYGVEHSAPRGTAAYDQAMKEFDACLELGEALQASHIVFHYNNKVITPANKAETIQIARENLTELNERADKAGIPILFENTGVNVRQNNLFTQEEFIAEAKRIPNGTLLDVGHAFANGWDIEAVIQQLQDKITVYHLNNNWGGDDDHQRILDGAIDYGSLAKWYKQYTPHADLVLEYGEKITHDYQGIADDVQYLQEHFIK